MWYLAFWAWFILLNMMISSSIYFPANNIISFFFMLIFLVYIHIPSWSSGFHWYLLLYYHFNLQFYLGILPPSSTQWLSFINLIYLVEVPTFCFMASLYSFFVSISLICHIIFIIYFYLLILGKFGAWLGYLFKISLFFYVDTHSYKLPL
jgi:hypothetical protein